MATKIIKKLTIRDAIGGKAQILAYAMTGRPKGKDDKGADIFIGTEGSPVKLLRVLGQVEDYKAGESDYGSFVELKGTFQGTNLQTGEIVDGVSKCILPDAIGDQLATAIKSGAQSVQFAVEISVSFKESAAAMYEFSAVSLLKPTTPKPIEDLYARLAAEGIEMTQPLKLAAPVLSDADRASQEAAAKAADAAKAAGAAKATKAEAPAPAPAANRKR